MFVYAFFHGPPVPPGLAGRAMRAGLPPAPLGVGPGCAPPCVAVDFADDGTEVGLAAEAPTAFVRDPRSRTALAGSVRLYDPHGLGRALGAPPGTGDADLILQAYLAWGPECAERLDGDFAFALWDGRTRRLFAARDRFGVRPLYYAALGGRVAVASRPGPVLAALEIPRRPDPWRVAELVTGKAVDPARSFFADVWRLPAGDILLADADSVVARPYWRPDRNREDSAHSPAEAAEAFLSLFERSVRRRLPPPGPDGAICAGADLSGGLDSSSVVAVARDLSGGAPPLPTFTAAFPGLDGADERPYSLAVERTGGVEPHLVFPVSGDPVAEREAAALGVDEPLYLPTWSMERAKLIAIRDAGLCVHLLGHGGDHVLSTWPEGVFPDLLRAGRWGRLWHEALALAPPAGAARLIWDLAVKDAARSAFRPALPPWVRAHRRPDPPFLLPDLSRDLRFAERSADLAPPLRTAVDRHAVFLHHAPTHEGLERMAQVSVAFGVEIRCPFWDRALVDLCFGVRRDLLYRDGVGRRLLRDAMTGRLPDAVRSRQSKATFDPLLNRALRSHAMDDLEEMTKDPGELSEWVDLPALQAAYDRFSAETAAEAGSSDAQILLRALTLQLWLRRIGGPGALGT